MDKKALRKLAKELEAKLPRAFKWDFDTIAGFDSETCGTVGCAIGLAVVRGMLGKDVNPASTAEDIADAAKTTFDLEGVEYSNLFMNHDNYVNPDKIKPAQVARAIRKFIRTGKYPTESKPQA